MSPRARTRAAVAAVAASAAALTVGATVLTAEERPEPTQLRGARPPTGAPPLVLDLGLRSDAEARALRRAERLYRRGRRQAAARIFGRYDSVPAALGTALAGWPNGAVARVRELARAQPRSALVRLHLGLALFWAGRRDEALEAWRAAARVEPDSVSAVRADDFLHPRYARGLPLFVPSFPPAERLRRLAPRTQLAALARAARGGDVRARLLYGVALQRLGRPLSARREYAAAARRAPGNAEAQVALAVAQFSKARPARAFARLGPLARRFPRAATVRYHLGLLLLWIGDVEEGRRQLLRARRLASTSLLGREAMQLLGRLEKVRTS